MHGAVNATTPSDDRSAGCRHATVRRQPEAVHRSRRPGPRAAMPAGYSGVAQRSHPTDLWHIARWRSRCCAPAIDVRSASLLLSFLQDSSAYARHVPASKPGSS